MPLSARLTRSAATACFRPGMCEATDFSADRAVGSGTVLFTNPADPITRHPKFTTNET